MDIKVTGESEEVNVPVEKIYDCYDCLDTGERTDGGDDFWTCHCVKERKEESDADAYWKEKDTI